MELTRRDWLRLSALGGVAPWIGCGSDGPSWPPPGEPSVASLGRGTRAELDDAELELVAGRVPSDMEGFVFIVGGVPYGDGTPLFTGDAQVLRLRFEGGRVRLKSRMLRTDDYLLDQAATGDLAFRNLGMLRMSTHLGARDFCNTALVPSPGGRLLATYDAGRPWEIDPETLDVVTPVGLHASWRPMFPPISPGLGLFPVHMASAHPVWDPDDGIAYLPNWAPPLEGLDTETFTQLLTWDGASEPVATELVDRDGAPAIVEQSLHQIHTTRRFVVLSDGAFSIEPEQMTGADVTRAQRPTSVFWIVPKAELTGGTATATRVEIPVESAHFMIERDDSADRITVALMHQNSADPSEWVRANDTLHHGGSAPPAQLVGLPTAPSDLAIQGRYTIDPTTGEVVDSVVLQDERLWGLTLWSRDERDPARPLGDSLWVTLGFDPNALTTRITEAYADHPHRVVPLTELPTTAIAPRLLRIDQSGSMTITDDATLPLGWLPMSPTFVPRRGGSPGEGYLVLLALGPVEDEVWILDGGDLGRGPIARLRHTGFDVGFSLHTTWLPDLPAPSSGYRVDRREDYGAALPALRDDARALATEVLGLA